MAAEISRIKQEAKAKIPIGAETKEWTRTQDLELPIKGIDIPGFKEWINWNGFNLNRQTGKGHPGFDFAAYLNEHNEVVLGLPSNTPIRAVADGRIAQVFDIPEFVGVYGVTINVEHGGNDSGMFSAYVHIIPHVKYGDEVKKGDIIAELYKDPDGDEGRLVHLHLELTNGWGTKGSSITGGGRILRAEDPSVISDEIYKYKAEPQGSSTFRLASLPDCEILIANFRKVSVG